MQAYFIGFVIIECIVLLILGIYRKLTKKIFTMISAVTAVICAVLLVSSQMGRRSDVKMDGEKSMYMAARLLEEGNASDCLASLTGLVDGEYEKQGIVSLRGAGYNLAQSYGVACTYLETSEEELAVQVREASSKKESIAKKLRKQIAEYTIENLALTDEKAEQYDAEMKIRFGNKDSDEEEEDTEKRSAVKDTVLRAKDAVNRKQYEEAYEIMADSAGDGDAQDAIILSEMYVKNYNQRLLAEDDAEYDYLLDQLTQKQVAMNLAGMDVNQNDEDVQAGEAKSDEEKKYASAVADYQNAQARLEIETVERAINYLQQSGIEKSSIPYQLQLAILYYLSDHRESAAEALDTIFAGMDTAASQFFGQDVYLLKEAYLVHSDDPSSDDFHNTYAQIMNGLYLNMFEDGADAGFEQFLLKYFRNLLSGVQIGNVDSSKFPQIQMNIFSADEKIRIDSQTLQINDTGKTVTEISVEQRELDNPALCFVLDHSGSMQGSSIRNAKQAIKQTILSADESMQMALVQFDSSAQLLTPLTDSAYMVSGQLDSIQAAGGTDIGAGLEVARTALTSVEGTKVVILLSDGYDGSTDQEMQDVLVGLQTNGIIVYAIGLEGCDEQYLSNIADYTGGAFIEAEDSFQLSEIYAEIQNFFQNAYSVEYVTDDTQEVTQRYTKLSVKNTDACAYRSYQTEKAQKEKEQKTEQQESNLYKEYVGGGN